MIFLYILAAAFAAANAFTALGSKNCISGCKCQIKSPRRLQIIDCDGPLILNETTFKDINTGLINVLSIENVIIPEIQKTAFKNFKILDDIVILNTKIGSIDAEAFSNVRRLKFTGCGFEDSPDLSSEILEEIHFGDCQLEEIPELGGLFSLTFLNLSGNYIKDLELESFAELFDLEELHLSNNEIFKLPPTLFINNQQLNTLYLDNNPIKRFYLNTTSNLETLSLKNCQLEVFDEKSTQKLSTLNTLNLAKNNIKTIPSKTFDNMDELSVINLSYNKLQKLSDDIFNKNKNLIKITLDGNNFTTLPNFYREDGAIFSTYTFSCNDCGLTSLSSTVFHNMTAMITLQLSHNKFTNVEGIFSEIDSLKNLDISYNNIESFTLKTFSSNRNLATLNIAGNPLGVLDPQVFASNKVLREIDARNASLKKLWTNTDYQIDNLHKLLLGNNKLTNVTLKDFQVTPTLEAIHLNDNPWVFDDNLCKVFGSLRGVSPIESTYNLPAYLDESKTLSEDIDGFSTIEWKDFFQGNCPNITDNSDSDYFYDNNDSDSYYDDDSYDDPYDSDSNDDSDVDFDKWPFEDTAELDGTFFHKRPFGSTEHDANNSLARASYILSITSVFVLSALVVLILIVTFTLCILRRNRNFDMHAANLPRFKIPIWSTQPSEKKHSGSVYRPLSEDLSGSKTPKLSRYEFSATPTVHSSNP